VAVRPLILYENDDSNDEDASNQRDRGGGWAGHGGGGESGGRVRGGEGGADEGRVVWEREEDVAHEWSASALVVAALDEVLASVEKVASDEAGALLAPYSSLNRALIEPY
jgi:hypothetical protein